jgi:hypothetical protein
MIPDLCRFMTSDLRRFMILDLHRFMVPDLRRFMILDLRRFMVPDLCKFTIPDLCKFMVLEFLRFRQIRPSVGVRFSLEFPNTSPSGKRVDSDDPFPRKLLNFGEKRHPRNVGVDTHHPENSSNRGDFLKLPPSPL